MSHYHTSPFLPPLSPLLDNLLPLRLNLLIIDLASRFALLPLRRRRGLDADCRGAARSDLFLGYFPRSGTVVDFVSGGWLEISYCHFTDTLRKEYMYIYIKLTFPKEGHQSKPSAFLSIPHLPAALLLSAPRPNPFPGV